MIKKPGIIFCLLLFFNSMASVQARSVEKQAVLAALTLNLGRFTTWPERKSPALNLCVIGNNVVQESFVNMNGKTINNKALRIINRSRLRYLSQCQLLYISALKRNILKQVLVELKDLPILTVGENFWFLKAGGMVGLESRDGKMQININLPAIEQSDLVMSSRILKLAKIFEFPNAMK
jgi:hypothetical protein